MARPVVSEVEEVLFESYPRRWALVLLGTLGALFCFGIARELNDHYSGMGRLDSWKLALGWVGVVLFGGGVLILALVFFRRGPSVVAVRDGVRIRPGLYRQLLIRWDQISDIRKTEHQQRRRTVNYVSFFLTEDGRKDYGFDRMSRFRLPEVIGEFQIGNVDVSQPLDDVALVLRGLWTQYK